MVNEPLLEGRAINRLPCRTLLRGLTRKEHAAANALTRRVFAI
jgi:hypothetical protein